MKKIISICLVLMASLSFTLKENKTSYSGHWVSEATENLGNGTWGVRDFNIGDKEWQIKFTMYFDSAKKIPVFTFRGVGNYDITAKSAKVEGAEEATFNFAKKYVTLHISDTSVIKKFGFAACHLKGNLEKDITSTGCSFLTSQSTCGQEYDLVAIKKNRLLLGQRPADGNMCSKEKRPTSLGSALVRTR
ncbi:MAG: hypothetical protein ACKO1F_16825 [Flammeovirgaceae bacterium]